MYLLCRLKSTKLDTLKHAYRLALDTAKSHGLKSIAFPPVTTHNGKEELTKSMMEVFDTFQEQQHCDLSVTVVIKKDDNSLHKVFMKIYSNAACNPWRRMAKVVVYWVQKSENTATVLLYHTYGYIIKFQEEGCITHIIYKFIYFYLVIKY